MNLKFTQILTSERFRAWKKTTRPLSNTLLSELLNFESVETRFSGMNPTMFFNRRLVDGPETLNIANALATGAEDKAMIVSLSSADI